MENVLERMVKEEKSEELARLNAVTIVNSLFSELLDRERDVLSRRFGLKGGKGETLEKIGQMHKLTRERVRQIEVASIRKIKKLENLETCLGSLKETISGLLGEHGGLLRRDYLLDILTVYCLEIGNFDNQEVNEETRSVYRNHFNFLISKLLEDDLETVKGSDKFNLSYKLKNTETKHLEDLADDLMVKIKKTQKTLSTEELLDLIKSLETYSKNQTKLQEGKTDITPVFKSQTFPDKAEIINSNKIIYSLVQAVKDIEQNKFGQWGEADSHEIKPKTINDKIYLVLKNENRPMHFTEIASKINEIKFDRKNANPATVHNELILDNRYVLTGRGMYGLKGWQK
ncbi:MAG: sigma factor-like helix-turn-helix DNA-binding protein [Candidatus Falkowbacteria bacterium]